MPANLSLVYCTEDDVQAFLSQEGELGRLDDTNAGSISTLQAGWLTKAINWATARVNFYLACQYETADLANSWIVNEWCTILACQWLSSRRGNPVPGSLKENYKAALEDMERVRSGEVHLSDCGTRAAAWPAWSNVRVDQSYALRKVRRERPLSESASGESERGRFPGANRDIAADYIIEPR